MKKESNSQSLQLYSYPTYQGGSKSLSVRTHPLYSGVSDTAVSVYTRGFPLESSTLLSIYRPKFSLKERLLLNLFSGLLNGASHYAIHKLRLKFQNLLNVRRYFLVNTFSIMMESLVQNYTQLFPIFDLTGNTFPFSSIDTSFYQVMFVTALQYKVGIEYSMLGKMYFIQFFTNLVLFLSTMASILYTSNESDNPIQAMAECTLQFLSSMAMELLLNYWEDPKQPLLQAIEYNCSAITRLLLSTKANVNALNESETTPTPLHLAVHLNRGKIVSLLIAAGANVNAINSFKETPLHLAMIQPGTTKIVTKLLAKGANVNVINKWGETPLHIEVLLFCRIRVLKNLLAAGADLNIASSDSGGRAIGLLQFRGIDHDILTELRDNNGFTPLCMAILNFKARPQDDSQKKF